MSTEIILSIVFLIFLIFWSGFFSASETALFSLSSTKIKAYQTNISPRKRLIASLVLNPKDLLVTIFMLNTLVNILIQNTSSSMFGKSGGWIFKIVFPFILMFIFGEIIPKYIGLQNNIKLADLVAPTINLMQKLLKPIRKIIVKITSPLSRIMFFYLHKEKSISTEELKHALKTSQEYGVLNLDEAELIMGYLNFQEATVKELMRPREDIIFFDINDPLSKLTHFMVELECSRLPVCDRVIDNVIGIISIRQFFLHRKKIKNIEELIKHLVKPFYIPENTPAKILMRHFEEHKQVLSLVVDEYGSISGLITKEDIVEEVIGDISDRRDQKSLYEKAGPNEIIASGRLELYEFNEIFNSHLISENNMITISGWLIEQLGDIPKSGAKFEIESFLFQILAADPNKIKRLYIRKLTDTKKEKAKK